MPIKALDNLVKSDTLKAEPPNQTDLDNLLARARVELKDAELASIAPESKFQLAYSAAHALALSALRWHGYRPNNKRYATFQTLEHTVGMPSAKWRVLDTAHRKRNIAEYEGDFDIEPSLLAELIKVTKELEKLVSALGPIR